MIVPNLGDVDLDENGNGRDDAVVSKTKLKSETKVDVFAFAQKFDLPITNKRRTSLSPEKFRPTGEEHEAFNL